MPAACKQAHTVSLLTHEPCGRRPPDGALIIQSRRRMLLLNRPFVAGERFVIHRPEKRAPSAGRSHSTENPSRSTVTPKKSRIPLPYPDSQNEPLSLSRADPKSWNVIPYLGTWAGWYHLSAALIARVTQLIVSTTSKIGTMNFRLYDFTPRGMHTTEARFRSLQLSGSLDFT